MDAKLAALLEDARQAIYRSWPNDSTIDVSALALTELAARVAALEEALTAMLGAHEGHRAPTPEVIAEARAALGVE